MKYILVGMVVLIWGLVIYKVIKGLPGNDISTSNLVYKPPPKDSIETIYTLLGEEYPDPFFNEMTIEEDTIAEIDDSEAAMSLPAPAPSSVPQIAPDPVPSIKYNGYIYNPATKKRTALITYNGNTMVVGVADKLDEQTQVLGINAIQLVISFKGKKVIIGVSG